MCLPLMESQKYLKPAFSVAVTSFNEDVNVIDIVIYYEKSASLTG